MVPHCQPILAKGVSDIDPGLSSIAYTSIDNAIQFIHSLEPRLPNGQV